MRHYWDKVAKEWVEYDHRANLGAGAVGPFIMSDIPEYRSPLGTGIVSGRAARREELKRHGCREVDPSEKPPGFYNKEAAQRHGREWLGAKPVGKRLPTTIGPEI